MFRLNIFTVGLVLAGVAHASAVKTGERPRVTVFGVIASESSQSDVVLISVDDGPPTALRTGERVGDRDLIISGVRGRYVEFAGAGGTFLVMVGEEEGGQHSLASSVAGTPSTTSLEGIEGVDGKVRMSAITRDFLVKERLHEVLMQAAAMPFMEDGELRGFTLGLIDHGSIFDRLGFSDGDVVVDINGVPINDVAGTIRRLRSLAGESQVTLGVLRDGKRTEIRVEVL